MQRQNLDYATCWHKCSRKLDTRQPPTATPPISEHCLENEFPEYLAHDKHYGGPLPLQVHMVDLGSALLDL